MDRSSRHLTRASIHLGRLAHNARLLEELAGDRPLWPVIKANAYGHGAEIVARHLARLGYGTLCVAHVPEAVALREAGLDVRVVVLSAGLPEHAEDCVAHGLEPVLCTNEMLEALSREAVKAERSLAVHVAVDTGMGRIGLREDEVLPFLERCREHPMLKVRGLMSHFPRADEADKAYSEAQLERFRKLVETTRGHGIEVCHLSNSAGVLDLPAAGFDAVRPGIALYGLRPAPTIANPRAAELRPVLEWKTRITYLKEVPAGTGLSYGHAFVTRDASTIATLPVGYGDGLSRNLSNEMEVLIGGVRCRQVGRVTMDQILVDVTPLRGRVALGDEAVLIGRQQDEELTSDELAEKLGTINYEIVTAIAARVPRVVVE